jgi:hypothetical protein
VLATVRVTVGRPALISISPDAVKSTPGIIAPPSRAMGDPIPLTTAEKPFSAPEMATANPKMGCMSVS